jgi:hypothetical protein
LRLAGRGPNSDSLFPPLAAVVVVAPNEGRPWHIGKLTLFARGSPTRGAVERSETERLYEGGPEEYFCAFLLAKKRSSE